MIDYSELDLPRKRDLERFRFTLGVSTEASLVRARLRTSRYGPLILNGRLRGGSELWLGGFFLGDRINPKRELIDLDIVGSGPDLNDGGMGEKQSRCSELTDLRHGKPLEVRFFQQPYGCFSLAGHLVRAPHSSDLLLGGWFVLHGGHVASRVVSIERIEIDSRGTRNVPTPLTRWKS